MFFMICGEEVATEPDMAPDTKAAAEIKAFILEKCQRCDSRSWEPISA